MTTQTLTAPQSRLTLERPDIWMRALSLATRTTGIRYLQKVSGELVACGGNYLPTPPPNKPIHPDVPADDPEDEIHWDYVSLYWVRWIDKTDRNGGEKWDPTTKTWVPRWGISCFVPEGEMEWLLHEVGHWIAATPAERLLPNYGYNDGVLSNGLGKAREIQAWGFEDIILSPFGTSRLFASPTQRSGIAFRLSQIPEFALRHASRNMRALGIDHNEWRTIYHDWIIWKDGKWNCLN